MPETSVDENHPIAGRKDKIGIARQVAPVQSIPEAHTMHQAAYSHLGLGIF